MEFPYVVRQSGLIRHLHGLRLIKVRPAHDGIFLRLCACNPDQEKRLTIINGGKIGDAANIP